MSKAMSVGGVTDRLTVTVTSHCELKERCPADQVRRGLVHERVIKGGDTVLIDGQRHTVRTVTTDYGPHLGRFSIRGEARQLAAAMLVLDHGATRYVDDTVEKICPSCAQLVVDFRF